MIHAVSVRPVRDEAGHAAAMREVEELWGAEPGTEAGDRLDVLLALVAAYEAEHHRVAWPEPVEAIRIRMEDLGFTRDDLGRILGIGSGRVSEVLNRRRRLTLEMIRALVPALGLPEACLIQPYPLVPADAPPRPAGTSRRAA